MGVLKIKVGTVYERIVRGPKGDPGESGALVGESKIWNGVMVPDGYLWEDGSEVSRTTYAALFAVLTMTVTGNNSGGNPNITGLASTTGVQTGWFVSGPGVPAGAYITAVSANSITLNVSTASGSTGGQYVLAPHGVGNGTTTFNLPDKRLRIPIGAGTGKNLGATDKLAETSRNARLGHSHSHSATTTGTVSGTASKKSSGTYLSGGIIGANTDHNHTQSNVNHPTGAVTASGGGTRLTGTGGHASTDLAVQAPGKNHGHEHTFSVTDPQHDHSLSASMSATTNVLDGGSEAHPYAAVNYIIKY